MSWNNRQVRYYDSDFGTPIQPIPNGGLIYYQTSNNIQPVNSSEQWRFYQQPVLVREMQPNQHNFAPAYPHHPFNSNMPVLGPNTQSVSVRINASFLSIQINFFSGLHRTIQFSKRESYLDAGV
jgi:hypothetical protein